MVAPPQQRLYFFPELSPEIVQEFQVINNGLSVESGGASGGSINVITRSGTNTIHGDVFIFAQDGAFNARDPFESEPGKPSFRRFRAGVALGGPIVKNRTFYYAAAEQEHNRGQIGSGIDPSLASIVSSAGRHQEQSRRHPGGAPFSLCHVGQGAQQGHGDGGCRPESARAPASGDAR
jgi:hypothetical protein